MSSIFLLFWLFIQQYKVNHSNKTRQPKVFLTVAITHYSMYLHRIVV